jgi:hypothetical protein
MAVLEPYAIVVTLCKRLGFKYLVVRNTSIQVNFLRKIVHRNFSWFRSGVLRVEALYSSSHGGDNASHLFWLDVRINCIAIVFVVHTFLGVRVKKVKAEVQEI